MSGEGRHGCDDPRVTRRSKMRFLRLAAVLAAALLAAVLVVPPYLQPPEAVESWLLFDGVCNLCNGFINFVADGDSIVLG